MCSRHSCTATPVTFPGLEVSFVVLLGGFCEHAGLPWDAAVLMQKVESKLTVSLPDLFDHYPLCFSSHSFLHAADKLYPLSIRLVNQDEGTP